MPNATSVGVDTSTVFATAVTRSFHSGLPPCASSNTPTLCGRLREGSG